MSSIRTIFIFIILLWLSIYTFSFGLWNWKRDNKLGGAAVIALALVTLALPTIIIIVRM